jgi:SAM-dependent methyltransferase
MTADSGRALRFGADAPAYERFRPDYPQQLADAVLAYAGRPIRSALEIGAGTGKATRLFAERGIQITATDPDGAMLAELQNHVPATVRPVRAAFEELTASVRFDLVYAAASLHWTDPAARWPRVAALLEPGGVFASCGGPITPADPAVAEAVRAARTPFLGSDDIPSPDRTPPEADMQWPGTELRQSTWFTDVRQMVIERRRTLSAADFVGYLGTLSAYLALPPAQQRQIFDQVQRTVPPTIEIKADVTLHLARRRD